MLSSLKTKTIGCLVLFSVMLSACATAAAAVEPMTPVYDNHYDVVVLGGSSAGVGAAIGAAREGSKVLLVEETNRLGGMISNGVTTDIGRAEASNGLFDEFRRKVAEYYEERGQLEESHNGLFAEPDVAESLIREMVFAEENIDTVFGYYLKENGGVIINNSDNVKRPKTITITNGTSELAVSAKRFVDATPAGDLLATVGEEGVDWRYGRESKAEYGENLAAENADKKSQAFNYRVIFQVGGYTDYAVPPDYEDNLPIYRQVSTRKDPKYTCEIDGKEYAGIGIQRCLMNKKMDMNLDRVGVNHGYPVASRAERKAIEEKLRNFHIGWLHYLRTERGMPELGLSADDYQDSGHFPTTLYVREGRRMIGEYIFTENDIITEKLRPPFKETSIAIGTYGADSHCVSGAEVSPHDDGCGEGGFWVGTKPYQVPYEVLLPKDHIENLIVPMAVSATHVAYSTLRMEPVRLNIGFASGTAAAMSVDRNINMRDLSVSALQDKLAGNGQMLLFFTDLPPDSPNFKEIQVLASRGIVAGYGDYSVGPNRKLKRSHATAFFVKAFEHRVNTDQGPTFSDVPKSHTQYEFIETLVHEGVIHGYVDGKFRPNTFLTESQTMKILKFYYEPEYLDYEVAHDEATRSFVLSRVYKALK